MGTLSRDTPPGQDPLDELGPSCAGCGRRLRYRGRRDKLVIYECEDEACPVVLVELFDRKRGG